ncbi:hypothetical protein ES703_107347 [subsurface metagenome]
MARVTYSPLIVEMSGKCADAVFSRWKGIDYVRSRVTPANPRSDLQTAQRDALKHTLTMWQSIKSWAKAPWDFHATGYALSGYNRYMDANILLVKARTAGVLTPYNAKYIKISAMAVVAGGAGEFTCTWTNVAGVPGTDFVTTHYRKTQTDAEEYAWTWDADTDPSLETRTITGLDTGEEYEVALYASDASPDGWQQSYNEILAAG